MYLLLRLGLAAIMLSTPAPHAPNFKVDSSDVVLVTASLCCGACAVNIEIGGPGAGAITISSLKLPLA